MQTRSQFLSACLNPCLLALIEEFSDARYVKYVLTTNDVIHLPIAFTIINVIIFMLWGFTCFLVVGARCFQRFTAMLSRVLKNKLPSVGHMVGHRVGHEVVYGLHHGLGHGVGRGLPNVLSTSELASPSFSSLLFH